MGLPEFSVEPREEISGFDLRMQHEAVDLIEESGKIAGVKAETPEGMPKSELIWSLPAMAGTLLCVGPRSWK